MKNYKNINVLYLGFFLLFGLNLLAQENETGGGNSFNLENGLLFKFNKGEYQFKIGGMIQPQIGFRKDSSADANYYLNSKRSYFNLSGKANKEKISFLVQTDFSLANPLLDAWVAYKPSKFLSLTVGQHLAIANNREMTLMETQLQFMERSILSTQYSATGREFGLFIASELNVGKMIFASQAAITSGDGRNSFGLTGTDYDLGGVKYAARLDALPFGKFMEGNDKLVADLKNEAKPKLALGVAFSSNTGASNYRGEGHGDFLLYNTLGRNQLPDYRKLYYDVLFKFKGFSLLAEYVIATGKVKQNTFLDITGINRLEPTEISELLALGTGLNTHFSYVFNKKYGVDFRYASVSKEFASNEKSIVKDQQEISFGLTKYIQENNLRINASLTKLNTGNSTSLLGTMYVQLVF